MIAALLDNWFGKPFYGGVLDGRKLRVPSISPIRVQTDEDEQHWYEDEYEWTRGRYVYMTSRRLRKPPKPKHPLGHTIRLSRPPDGTGEA